MLNLPRRTFCRLVTISERLLVEIEKGKTPSEAFERRHTELTRLVGALGEVVRREALGAWFLKPNPAFGGLKPIEVVERGETDRLWEMVYFLRSGAVA